MDDDIHQRHEDHYIVLRDGRQISHKDFWIKLNTTGIKEPLVREALYELIFDKSFEVSFGEENLGKEIEIERFFKKPIVDRKRSEKILFIVDGISSEDISFSNVMKKYGETYEI